MDPDTIGRTAFPSIDHQDWRALIDEVRTGSDATVDTSAWRIVQRVDHPDPAVANAQARADVAGGATGLALVFTGAPNGFGYGLPAGAATVSTVLDGIPLDEIHLRIDAHPDSRRSVEWVLEALGKRRIRTAELSLSFGIDPAALFGGTGRLRMSIEALRASLPQSLAGFLAAEIPAVLLEADGRVYHLAGATEAQELGAMLSAAVAHIRMVEEARQPVLYATPHLGFAVAVDHDVHMSTAKIMALRLLWAWVQRAISIEPSPANIHAETSLRAMTVRDPETNILRNTMAALAAAAGGADTVSVVPHTTPHGLPDPAARRIARNTQLILSTEGRIGSAGGFAHQSAGMDPTLNELCIASWKAFQEIEAEGGILESLRDGHIQNRIAESRRRRNADIADGVLPIIGATRYPPEGEPTVATLHATTTPMPEDGTVFCERLIPVRDDELA